MIGNYQATLVQVTNIAPSVQNDQIKSLFAFIGEIEQIIMYPIDPLSQCSSRICYIKYADKSNIDISLHLSNTVFIDRALIVAPSVFAEIPSESVAMQYLAPSDAVSVMKPVRENWPTYIINQVVGLGGEQKIDTCDPMLHVQSLPRYPSLSVCDMDPNKIDDLRRTVYVSQMPIATTPQDILDHFNKIGDVRHVRMARNIHTPDIVYAFVEFINQQSVPSAILHNGSTFNGQRLSVAHAFRPISKNCMNGANTRELEDAMRKVNEAQALISAAVDIAEKKTEPKKRSRSRGRGSSHTKSRANRSRSRGYRSRSRGRRSRSRGHRSRSRGRRSRSRVRYSRIRRSRSRTRRSRSRPRRSRSRAKRSRSRGERYTRRSRSRSRHRVRRRSRSPRKRSRSHKRRSRSHKRSPTPKKLSPSASPLKETIDIDDSITPTKSKSVSPNRSKLDKDVSPSKKSSPSVRKSSSPSHKSRSPSRSKKSKSRSPRKRSRSRSHRKRSRSRSHRKRSKSRKRSRSPKRVSRRSRRSRSRTKRSRSRTRRSKSRTKRSTSRHRSKRSRSKERKSKRNRSSSRGKESRKHKKKQAKRSESRDKDSGKPSKRDYDSEEVSKEIIDVDSTSDMNIYDTTDNSPVKKSSDKDEIDLYQI